MSRYFNVLGSHLNKGGAAIAAVLIASLMISACDEATNSDEFLTRAQEYRDKGDLQASIIEAKNALRINRDDQDARFILGSNYLDLGDWLSAEATLETAIGQGGTLEYAIIPLLARAKLPLGKVHDVLKIAGVRSDMSDELKARIMVVRGRAHSGLRNHTEANKSFNDALAADPKSYGAYLGLAGLAIRQGDEEKSRELLSKAVEFAPEEFDVVEFQARYYFLKKEFAKSEKYYRLLLVKRPTRVAFHAGLVNVLIASERYKAANSALNPLLARSPKNIRLNYLRALTAFRSKDYITAYNASSMVLGLNTRHTRSMLIAGASAYAKKEYGQAAQYLQQYVQINPSNAEARMLLGDVQLRQNRVSDAADTLESVAKDQPDNVSLLLAIGRASSMAGDLQKSGDYFQRAIELDPESTKARAAFGTSQIALGKTDAGIEELEKAVREDANLRNSEISLILHLAREKRFKEALEASKRFQERHPKKAIGHTIAGLMYFSMRDTDKAKAAFRIALKLDPTAADAALNLASMAVALEKYAEARDILTAILKHRPRDSRLLTMLATVYTRLKDIEGAMVAYERILQAKPGDLLSRVKLSQLLLLSGRVQKAYLVAKGGPTSLQIQPAILEVLGQAQLILGMRADATETFKLLVKTKPESATAKYYLAKSHIASLNLVEAQRELEAALTLDPNDLRAKLALASVLLQRNDLEKATSVIGELVKQSPHKPASLILQGRLALQKGKPEDAIEPLNKAQKVTASSQLTSLLAMAQVRSAGRGVGLETLRQWLKKYPQDINIRFQLANSHMIFGQYDEASEEFYALLEIQPKNWIFLNNLAESLSRLDKFKEALPHAAAAYNLAPSQPVVLDTYGSILLEVGDIEQATTLLQTAARRAPDSAEILFSLARAYERAGNTEKARALLKEILPEKKLFRSREAAQKLLKKLGG